MIIFGRRVKRANKAYERNFNENIDLGVQVGIQASDEGSPFKRLQTLNSE